MIWIWHLRFVLFLFLLFFFKPSMEHPQDFFLMLLLDTWHSFWTFFLIRGKWKSQEANIWSESTSVDTTEVSFFFFFCKSVSLTNIQQACSRACMNTLTHTYRFQVLEVQLEMCDCANICKLEGWSFYFWSLFVKSCHRPYRPVGGTHTQLGSIFRDDVGEISTLAAAPTSE